MEKGEDVFKTSGVYNNQPVTRLYRIINKTLREKGITTYSAPKNHLFKGHLAPNADFLYKFQRDAN